MSTSDQNPPPPQAEASSAERNARHGRRGRGRTGGRHEQGRSQSQGSTPRRADSTLNLDELRELTELFTTHGLTDFEFENADIRIRLSRNPAPSASAGTHVVIPAAAPGPQAALYTAESQSAPPPTAVTTPSTVTATPAATATAAEEAPEEDLHVISSPIVGTFYRSSSPTADPFVRVGSRVEPDSVVCIIEAMKLMNEIQAETSGVIAKIYVENGQPVEYGQPLFGVKK